MRATHRAFQPDAFPTARTMLYLLARPTTVAVSKSMKSSILSICVHVCVWFSFVYVCTWKKSERERKCILYFFFICLREYTKWLVWYKLHCSWRLVDAFCWCLRFFFCVFVVVFRLNSSTKIYNLQTIPGSRSEIDSDAGPRDRQLELISLSYFASSLSTSACASSSCYVVCQRSCYAGRCRWSYTEK